MSKSKKIKEENKARNEYKLKVVLIEKTFVYNNKKKFYVLIEIKSRAIWLLFLSILIQKLFYIIRIN